MTQENWSAEKYQKYLKLQESGMSANEALNAVDSGGKGWQESKFKEPQRQEYSGRGSMKTWSQKGHKSYVDPKKRYVSPSEGLRPELIPIRGRQTAQFQKTDRRAKIHGIGTVSQKPKQYIDADEGDYTANRIENYLNQLEGKEKQEAYARISGFSSEADKKEIKLQIMKDIRNQYVKREEAKDYYPSVRYKKLVGGIKEKISTAKTNIGRTFESPESLLGGLISVVSPQLSQSEREEKYRQKARQEAYISKRKDILEQRSHEVAKARAYGGILSTAQQLSLDKARMQLQYKYSHPQKPQRPVASRLADFSGFAPKNVPASGRISPKGGFMDLSLGTGQDNPFGLSFSASTATKRTTNKPHIRQRTSTNPVNDMSGNNILFGSKNKNGKKRKHFVSDPFGAGGYF